MNKTTSSKSIESQDSVDMVFPHLSKKVNSTEDDNNPYIVTSPITTGSHVVYTVKGIDNDGKFE